MPPINRSVPSLENMDKEQLVKTIKRMIEITDELASIMIEEEKLVQARETKKHEELLKRKQRLTLDYRTSIKIFALKPDLLKDLPSDLRQAARANAKKLSAVAQRNANYLRGAILAGQKLAQTVIDIIRQEKLPKIGYANPMTAKLALGTYSPTCKSLAVNRRV